MVRLQQSMRGFSILMFMRRWVPSLERVIAVMLSSTWTVEVYSGSS